MISGTSYVVKEIGSVSILEIHGNITIKEGLDSERAIKELISKGRKLIFISLINAGCIDSFGIGQLVSFFTLLNENNGVLKFIVDPNSTIKSVLDIYRFYINYDVYSDEETAINSFNQ